MSSSLLDDMEHRRTDAWPRSGTYCIWALVESPSCHMRPRSGQGFLTPSLFTSKLVFRAIDVMQTRRRQGNGYQYQTALLVLHLILIAHSTDRESLWPRTLALSTRSGSCNFEPATLHKEACS